MSLNRIPPIFNPFYRSGVSNLGNVAQGTQWVLKLSKIKTIAIIISWWLKRFSVRNSLFFRKNRPKEWPMFIFFKFFQSVPLFPKKSYKWIIAKNENQFGFILRFGPPIKISQSIKKSNSRNRYKIIVPKSRIVRKFRIFHRIYHSFEFDIAINFLSKNQKRIMIMWSFDSYKWLITGVNKRTLTSLAPSSHWVWVYEYWILNV